MPRTCYFIPARRNSKGLPFKNRKLFDEFERKIPKSVKDKICVSSDDEYIEDRCEKLGIRFFKRNKNTSNDKASMKSVLQEFTRKAKLGYNDVVVTLYLTYPERGWGDVASALEFYESSNAKSLLCKKEAKTHPYLCMYEKVGSKGKQIVPHDKYRRQDYPKCFEISHFVSIVKVSELNKLNNNLYNANTVFFPVPDVMDVYTPDDYETYLNSDVNKKPGVFVTTASARSLNNALNSVKKFKENNEWFSGKFVVLWSDSTGSPYQYGDVDEIKDLEFKKVDDENVLDAIDHVKKNNADVAELDKYLSVYVLSYVENHGVVYCDNDFYLDRDVLESKKEDAVVFRSKNKICFVISSGIKRKKITELAFGYVKQYKYGNGKKIRADAITSFLKLQYRCAEHHDKKKSNVHISSDDALVNTSNKFLIIGNAPDIESLEIDKLYKDITTIGINRSWHLFETDYLFFQDYDILHELKTLNKNKTPKLITTDHIENDNRFSTNDNVIVYKRNKKLFPDSVSNAIDVFNRFNKNGVFYLYGVSLIWNERLHHFWQKSNIHVNNTYGRDWYEKRFDYILNNIRQLKNDNIKIISTTEKSKLNAYLKYVNINELYEK